jgi:arginine exporter protein ArgO
MLLYGFVLWGLSLFGVRLPLHLPWWLAVILQLGVLWYIWKGWRMARRAPRNHLRLFNAQEAWATAFALQGLILFLW